MRALMTFTEDEIVVDYHDSRLSDQVRLECKLTDTAFTIEDEEEAAELVQVLTEVFGQDILDGF